MNKLFAVCPFCGKRLCKAVEGTVVDMQCPSCFKEVEITVKQESVKVENTPLTQKK